MLLPCIIMGCMVWKLLHRLSCHRESQCLLGQGGCLCALLPVCLLSQHSQSAMHSILHKKIVFPEAIIKLSMQTSPPAPCALVTIQWTRDKHKSMCGGDGEADVGACNLHHPKIPQIHMWGWKLMKCIPRCPHRQHKIALLTAPNKKIPFHYCFVLFNPACNCDCFFWDSGRLLASNLSAVEVKPFK